MKFKVLFYQKEDGTEPAKVFLNSLDKKMRAKMVRTIETLQNNGTDLREPYSKYLEDGIFELRAKVGLDISRVLYFFFVGQVVFLVIGIVIIYLVDFKDGFLYEIHEILHGNFDDDFGTYRLFLWKRTFGIFHEFPILGSGPDSFAIRFMAKYPNRKVRKIVRG